MPYNKLMASGFDLSKSCHSEYEEKLENERLKQAKKSGEILRRDDEVISFEEGKGVIRTFFRTASHLEEDLSQMLDTNEKQDFILTPEKHKEVIHEAYRQVVENFGYLINKKYLEHCFPGITKQPLAFYDFDQSRIHCFVLDFANFDVYREASNPDVNNEDLSYTADASGCEGSFGRGLIKMPNLELRGTITKENPDRRYVVAIREPIGNTAEEVADELRATARHEVLHCLRVGADLPNNLKDGLVEYLAKLSAGPAEGPTRISYWPVYSLLDSLYSFSRSRGFTLHECVEATLDHQGEAAQQLVTTWKDYLGASFLSNLLTKELTEEDLTFARDYIKQRS